LGLIAGLAAFVLSLLTGFLAGAHALFVFLRAGIFGVVFFGLGIGVRSLINIFFADLFSGSSAEEEQDTLSHPGSHVDIVLDSEPDAAIPERYRNRDDPEEIGNFEDLTSGMYNAARVQPKPVFKGLDQQEKDEYNSQDEDGFADEIQEFSVFSGGGRKKDKAEFDAPTPVEPVFTPSFGSEAGDIDGLADLDAMAGAFSSGSDSGVSSGGSSNVPSGSSPSVVSTGRSKSAASGKTGTMQGDFNPKELAEGIRTILSTDK
jgi:hypothetical protein